VGARHDRTRLLTDTSWGTPAGVPDRPQGDHLCATKRIRFGERSGSLRRSAAPGPAAAGPYVHSRNEQTRRSPDMR
jgi:hypothetical protein